MTDDRQDHPILDLDVDRVRQRLVEDIATEVVPFLLPAVRGKADETGKKGFVPPYPGSAWILKYPGFRAIAAFNRGEEAQLRVRDELMDSRLMEDGWHLPDGEVRTVERVFEGFCYSIAHAIACAWVEALLTETERVTGDEGRHILYAADVGDYMLPRMGETFHAVAASCEIDVTVALDVLRISKARLPEGEVLPAPLATHFIGFD